MYVFMYIILEVCNFIISKTNCTNQTVFNKYFYDKFYNKQIKK